MTEKYEVERVPALHCTRHVEAAAIARMLGRSRWPLCKECASAVPGRVMVQIPLQEVIWAQSEIDELVELLDDYVLGEQILIWEVDG